MIKSFLSFLILIFVFSNFVLAQTIPQEFNLSKSSKKLNKISASDATPLSNSDFRYSYDW